MCYVNESCRLKNQYAHHNERVRPLIVIHSCCVSSKDDHSLKCEKQVNVCQRKKSCYRCKCRRSWI